MNIRLPLAPRPKLAIGCIVEVIGRSYFNGFIGTVVDIDPNRNLMPVKVQLNKWSKPNSFNRDELKVLE